MTRNALAIVALFLGLVATQFAPVSADSTCTGFAREQCERMQATTGSSASFSVQSPARVHWFTPGEAGREHFEAMSVLAPERYRMDPAPAVGGQFGEAEYDRVLVLMENVAGVTAPSTDLMAQQSEQQRYREESTMAAETDASYRTTNGATDTLLPDGRWVRTHVRDDGTVQTDFIGQP